MLLHEAINKTGVDVYEHLDRQAEVPVVTAAACQGDVSVLRVTEDTATKDLPRTGVVLVRSEASSHTHVLHGEGCLYDPADERRGSLVLGKLTVPEGTEALLSHQEHGALLITPGTYRIGRQREWAGEWQMVAD